MQDWYRDGIPIWWDESERVAFNAESRISRSRAAIERAQESAGKNKTVVHGRYFVAKPVPIGGGELPTRDEWFEEQKKKRGKDIPKRRDEPNIVQGRK